MKKIFMMLALTGVSMAGMAQSNESAEPTEKYSVATNSFWSNWFVQANVVGTAFYGNQESGWNHDKSPFESYRNNLGLSVALGKWFTPGLGLRTKLNGFWGRTVPGGEDYKNVSDNANKYWTLNEQVLFNLSNMLCGYNESRVWNFIPYAGAGIGRNMSYNKYGMDLTAGLLNTFRLSNKVALNLDLNWAVCTSGLDGVGQGAKSTEPKKFNKDDMFSVEVGVTYNLGSAKWKKVPDVDAIKALTQGQIDALNAQVADAQAENDKLKSLLAEQKASSNKQTVKEVIAAPVSVFFNIGKSKIASRKDMQNVKDLVEVAKNNNCKIVVTGYADSKTGSASYNQKLSQKRADTVANELVKLGVSRENIETVAVGGVNTLSPVSYNRRTTVEIK